MAERVATPTDGDGALPAGTLLGRYEIVRTIGSGGMGTVYEAQHVDLGKRVAVKTMRRQVTHNAVIEARFLREGRIASRIDHPHVVAVSDFGVDAGVAYLVMEYLEGETLAQVLEREGALSVAATVRVLLPILDALAVAHDAGIVHRDVKPENVFLARQRKGEPVPKLLDFGISKVDFESDFRLTRTGTMLGTPHFLAPELARGAQSGDALCDQYAVGVVLYECVTGRSPFDSDSFLPLLQELIAGIRRAPRSIRPDLPEAFETVVLRAAACAREERFASVRALGYALLDFAEPAVREAWERDFASGAADAAAAARRAPPVLAPGPAARPTRPRPPAGHHRCSPRDPRPSAVRAAATHTATPPISPRASATRSAARVRRGAAWPPPGSCSWVPCSPWARSVSRPEPTRPMRVRHHEHSRRPPHRECGRPFPPRAPRPREPSRLPPRRTRAEWPLRSSRRGRVPLPRRQLAGRVRARGDAHRSLLAAGTFAPTKCSDRGADRCLAGARLRSSRCD